MSDDLRHLRLDSAGGAPPPGDEPSPPPRDELDALLREWHQANADRAAAGRDRLLDALARRETHAPSPTWSITVRRIALRAAVPLAAAAAIAMVVVPFLRHTPTTPTIATAVARNAPATILACDSGRLEALAGDGQPLGPLTLEHTDVQAAITGAFARVTLTQRFRNPHTRPIDGLYTLPLRPGGVVDELQITLADRVVLGEVVPADQAESELLAARRAGITAGHIAEQRPSSFMQTVVNLKPGEPVDVRISYVEPLTRETDGDWSFTFPASLTPRFAASDDAPAASAGHLPSALQPRAGLVLLAPAIVHPDADHTLPDAAALASATPIQPPTPDRLAAIAARPARHGQIEYPDGQREPVIVYAPDDTGWAVGRIGERWMAMPRAADTGAVTPAAPPSRRPSDDLSIRLHLDTGGPGLLAVDAPGFPTVRQDTLLRGDGLASRCIVTVQPSAQAPSLPNQSFTLRWRLALPSIPVAAFTERSELGDFVALVVSVPNMIDARHVLPREIIFVIDPALHADDRVPDLLASAINALNPQDTFNLVVPVRGDTSSARLWRHARLAKPETATAAVNWWSALSAADAAVADTALDVDCPRLLEPAPPEPAAPPMTIAQLQSTPPDGREVVVRIADDELDAAGLSPGSVVMDGSILFPDASDASLPMRARVQQLRLPRSFLRRAAENVGGAGDLALIVTGRWLTDNGKPVLIADRADLADAPPLPPSRVAVVIAGDDAREQALHHAIASHATDLALRTVRLDTESAPLSSRAAPLIASLPRPLLSGVALTPSPELAALDFEPTTIDGLRLAADAPLVIIGRAPMLAAGTITLSGQSLSGPWSATVSLPTPPSAATASPTPPGPLPSLWAKARIDRLSAERARHEPDSVEHALLSEQITALASQFGVVTEHTSLIAVEHRRVVVEGRPVLAPVPVERPAESAWSVLLADHTPAVPGAATANLAVPTVRGRGFILATPPVAWPVATSVAADTFGAAVASDTSEVLKAAGARAESKSAETSLSAKPPSARDAGPPSAAAPIATVAGAADPAASNRADTYYNTVNAQLTSLEQTGLPPPDRLAAAAAANFIAQSALEGDLASAQRAQALFQSRYPDDPLISDAAAVLNQSPADDALLTKRAGARGGEDGHGDAARKAAPMKDRAGAQALDVNQLAQLAQRALARETELSRRLDPRLYQRLPQPRPLTRPQYAGARQSQQQTFARAQEPAPPPSQQQQQLRGYSNSLVNRIAVENTEGELIVSVLVTRLDESLLDALRRAGLRVQSTLADASVIIGALSPESLADVALVDGVQRIEPATTDSP